MTIIDAQVHIWKPETPDRPYIKEDASKPHRPIPLGYENLLHDMKIAGWDPLESTCRHASLSIL